LEGGGMMASHENNNEQIRGLGLGRGYYYFQSSAPINKNSLNKIIDYYEHEAVVGKDEKEDEEDSN
jgi:hypothetical protein